MDYTTGIECLSDGRVVALGDLIWDEGMEVEEAFEPEGDELGLPDTDDSF